MPLWFIVAIMLSIMPLAALTISQLAFSRAFKHTLCSMLTWPSVSRAVSSFANFIAWWTSQPVALNLSKHWSPEIWHKKVLQINTGNIENQIKTYFWSKNFNHYSDLVTVQNFRVQSIHNVFHLKSFIPVKWYSLVTITFVAIAWLRSLVCNCLSFSYGRFDFTQLIQSIQF